MAICKALLALHTFQCVDSKAVTLITIHRFDLVHAYRQLFKIFWFSTIKKILEAELCHEVCQIKLAMRHLAALVPQTEREQ